MKKIVMVVTMVMMAIVGFDSSAIGMPTAFKSAALGKIKQESHINMQFPRLMAIERINQQLSAPAPQLLPTTPKNFGPNIAGLVSWCKADMAMEYALKYNCAGNVGKDPMITTLKRVVIGEHKFKDDITKATQLYRNKDANGLLNHLSDMSHAAKYQEYPLGFDNVMNQLYGADLDDAVHPYRMMVKDLENDYSTIKSYLTSVYRAEEAKRIAAINAKNEKERREQQEKINREIKARMDQLALWENF